MQSLMSEDMESKGIFFDLQWKTKSGGSNAEEFASIGIWEVDDSSLDWYNFKPYLCQTLGNVENVSISYVDSDGDEIPIESDGEFQEALKFARRKAAIGQKIILKVEKLDTQSTASGGVELMSNPMYLKSSNFIKERLKINCNGEEHDLLHFSPADGPIRIGNTSCKVKTKSKTKDILCPLQNCDAPPLWFKKYMKKIKSEIICEVTANVNSQMKKLLEDIGQKAQPVIIPTASLSAHSTAGLNGRSSAWLVTKTKKKTSDDDSSDGARKVEIKDSKILNKIEKLHRRERKLDHKKEKLEQKSKRMAERKEREYLSKLMEMAGCKESHVVGTSYKLREPEKAIIPKQKISVSEIIGNVLPPRDAVGDPLGVTVNSDDMRTTSVKRNTDFTKVWKVVNSGSATWTDETEVKLSWGNAGLIPEAVSLKCPLLAPGQEGEIAIKFSSPNFPGIFESHWHFYHKNVRFGGRMSCIVSVDLIKVDDVKPKSESRNQSLSSSSSAEFFLIPPASHDGNDAIVVDGDMQNASVSPPASAAPLESEVHDVVLVKSDSFSPPSARTVEGKNANFSNEGECSCSGEKEIEFESIFTDDLSASDGSSGSDSDDKFVVVPMPPCFRFDVPLNAGGPHIVKATGGKIEENVVAPKHPATKELISPLNLPSTSHALSEDVKNAQTPNCSKLIEIPVQREVSHDTGEVISVPIKPLQPKPNVGSYTFQPAVTQMLPKCQSPKPHIVMNSSELSPSSPPPAHPVSSSESVDALSGSDQFTSSSVSARSSPVRSSSSKPQQYEKKDKSNSGSEQSANIPQAGSSPRSSPSPAPSSSRPIDLMPRGVSDVIHGAVNVTTSALNTALAAFDSILVNPVGSSVSPGIVYSEASGTQQTPVPVSTREDPPPPPMDAQMAEGLSQLVSMGFIDLEFNEALLRVHNHNLTEVIEILLNGGP